MPRWLRLTASLLTVIIGVGSEVRAGSPCIARLMGFEVFLVRFCATPHYIACHEWHELNPLAQSKLVQGIPRVGLCHARKGTRTQMRACVDVHGTHARMCCPCRQTHRCCAWQPSSTACARMHAARARMRHGHVCCFRRPRRSNAAEPEWDWEASSLNEQRGQ